MMDVDEIYMVKAVIAFLLVVVVVWEGGLGLSLHMVFLAFFTELWI